MEEEKEPELYDTKVVIEAMEKYLNQKLKTIQFQSKGTTETDSSIENLLIQAINEYVRMLKEAKALKLEGIRTIPNEKKEYLKQLKEIDHLHE